MPEAPHIEERFGAVRRRLLRTILLTGVAYLLMWTMALSLLCFLADYLFRLPPAIRAVGIGLELVALGVVAFLRLVRPLRIRHDDDDIALMLERAHPELRSRVISSVQLGREDAEEDVRHSRAMIGALQSETVTMTRSMDFRGVVSLRLLKRVAIGALIVAAIAAGVSVRWHRQLGVWATRLTLKAAEYPTATIIDDGSVEPGDKTLPLGDPVSLAICVSEEGVVPEAGLVRIVTEDEESIRVPALRVAGDVRYEATVENVVTPFTYQFEIGDARSALHTIKFTPRPALAELRLTVRPPRYTGLPVTETESGDVSAPLGSMVELRGRATKPLKSATLYIGELPPMPLEIGGDQGRKVRGSFEVLGNNSYHILLRDREELAEKEPPQYMITGQRDRPPLVKIRKPQRDRNVTPYALVPLSLLARDDYGVAKAEIRATILRGTSAQAEPELGEPVTIPLAGEFGQKIVELEYLWDLRTLRVEPGNSITFYVMVTDNHEPRPANTARSLTRELLIVKPEVLFRQLMKEREEAIRKITRLKKLEEATQEAVEDIIEGLGTTDETGPKDDGGQQP